MLTVSNHWDLKLTGSVMLCCIWQTQSIPRQRDVRLTVSVTLCCRWNKKKTTSSATRRQHSFAVCEAVRTTIAQIMCQKGSCNHPSKKITFILVKKIKSMDLKLPAKLSKEMIKLYLRSFVNCFWFTPLLFCVREPRDVLEDPNGHAKLIKLRFIFDASLLWASIQDIAQCKVH